MVSQVLCAHSVHHIVMLASICLFQMFTRERKKVQFSIFFNRKCPLITTGSKFQTSGDYQFFSYVKKRVSVLKCDDLGYETNCQQKQIKHCFIAVCGFLGYFCNTYTLLGCAVLQTRETDSVA